MISHKRLLKALNVAFDETIKSEYRQRMAACLLDKDGNILSVGHNTKQPYFWMNTKNGYRKDQRGSHCELDAVRNYVAKIIDSKSIVELNPVFVGAMFANKAINTNKIQEQCFFELVKSLKIYMIVVARRKGGLLSNTRGCSKPCNGCWEFLRRCGIKSVVYYDKDNHFIEKTLEKGDKND